MRNAGLLLIVMALLAPAIVLPFTGMQATAATTLQNQMKRVFPDAPIVELPFVHPIFHQLYDFPGGLPKIHEHDGGPAKAFGIVYDGRLVVFFSFDCDLGDGLEDEEIHHDPPDKREAAVRTALNIVHYVLSH